MRAIQAQRAHVIAAPFDCAGRFAGQAIERITATVCHRRQPERGISPTAKCDGISGSKLLLPFGELGSLLNISGRPAVWVRPVLCPGHGSALDLLGAGPAAASRQRLKQ
jgi:hypothetical protein